MKGRSTNSVPDIGPFVECALPRVLPVGHLLVLNSEDYIITHIDEQRKFIKQCAFAPLYFDVAELLITSYPDYCPLEDLLSLIRGGSVTACRAQIVEAIDYGSGAYDALIKPIRNRVARIRADTMPLGFDIRSIVETGYIIIPVREVI